MPDNSVPIEVKALTIVRDHLVAAAQEITQLMQEKMPQEFKDKPEAHMEIEQCFPKELAELLNFEDQGQWTKISPKQFLGSDNFARVLAIVKELQGEYISAGKNSHFKIPKVEG